MSAVWISTPITRAISRTIACVSSWGACSNRCARASSTSLIWSMTKRNRAMSRRSSRSVFGGRGTPSVVSTVAWRCGALRNSVRSFEYRTVSEIPHTVHDARALTIEALTLTVRALRMLLRERWNRCHVTVIWFATQPTDEDAFEQSSVEPICFRAAMLARYGYAR